MLVSILALASASVLDPLDSVQTRASALCDTVPGDGEVTQDFGTATPPWSRAFSADAAVAGLCAMHGEVTHDETFSVAGDQLTVSHTSSAFAIDQGTSPGSFFVSADGSALSDTRFRVDVLSPFTLDVDVDRNVAEPVTVVLRNLTTSSIVLDVPLVGSFDGVLDPGAYQLEVSNICSVQRGGVCSSTLVVDLAVDASGAPGCTGLCATLAQAVDDANTAYGSTVLVPGTGSLGTDRVTGVLEDLADDLVASGCTLDPDTLSGFGGAMVGNRVTGDATGGPVAATFGGGVFAGSLGGLTFADGTWRGSRFAAPTSDGGFLAGTWVRVAGRRGVVVGLYGTCDGGAGLPGPVESWYGAPLSWP
ncbi:MAG: hypothetical protein H6736_14270 [Alphaproteobacteria bacterium]|nr:hypothetical protein [Alphaproteobacteria bacterium]MCB9692972.1 hypothetical protein [Alphaproteobacteria bacterium]